MSKARALLVLELACVERVLRESLKKDTLVVLSFGGKLDPLYAALFKPNTLNLVLK